MRAQVYECLRVRVHVETRWYGKGCARKCTMVYADVNVCVVALCDGAGADALDTCVHCRVGQCADHFRRTRWA